MGQSGRRLHKYGMRMASYLGKPEKHNECRCLKVQRGGEGDLS
jgi:hypothetical protein